MSKQNFKVRLQARTLITPSVAHLVFQREDGEAFHYIPGQFITVHWTESDQIYRRSYSLAAAPSGAPTIEFALSYIAKGKASEYLFNLAIGDSIECSGPVGRLILTPPLPKRLILVATGTGVTPYRAMLPMLEQAVREQGTEVVILQGVRTQADLLYREDFVSAQKIAGIQFRAYYSREEGPFAEPYEYAGRLHNAFADLNLKVGEDQIYLCGNPAMIDEAFAQLTAFGFPSSDVRREKYISSK